MRFERAMGRTGRRQRVRGGLQGRRAGRGVTATLAFLALLASAASAQTSAALRLTLDDALRLAEGDNPAYRRASNDVLLNGVEMSTTWLEQILPRAELTAFTQFTGNLQRNAIDNFGNPIENPAADWRYFSRTVQNLNLSWSFQGQSLFQAQRQQGVVNQQRDLARERSLTELEVLVQRRFMDAVEQRDLMETEEELLEARRLDLEVAERLFSLALRTRVDVLTAELEIEQQALALQRQRADYERALLALRTTLGADDPRPLDLQAGALPLFDPSGLDPAELVRRALDVNPVLRETSASVRGADLELGASRNAWWPRISMGVDVFRRAQADQGAALFDVQNSGGLESQFFVQLDLPFLRGFAQNRQATQRAAVALDNRREADREARLGVEAAVRGAVLELSNQWTQLRLAQRSLEIAAETLRLVREEYRLGTRSFEELRGTFEQDADTRRQVVAARYAFVDALLDLEEAVGAGVRPELPAGTR